MATAARIPSLFICHGGGPFPLLNHPSQHEVIAAWKRHAKELYSGDAKPKAIVVVSAHYETSGYVGVGAAAQPKMLYDYSGFPPETYKVQYPAPGAPELAKRIAGLLEGAGIKAKLEENRPFDHGVFVPLMVMFPDADIPVVPLSVLRSQVPSEHIAIGRALRKLRDEGVLVLGSGASSHSFGARQTHAGVRFNEELSNVIGDAALTPEARAAKLDTFLEFPGVEEAQTRGAAEHLMPLFTTLGTAGGAETGEEVAALIMGNGHERHWVFRGDAAAGEL